MTQPLENILRTAFFILIGAGASWSCVYSPGGRRVGECDISFWVYTRLLGPHSHRVSTRLLRLFSPWVLTLTLSPRSFQVFTRSLRGRSTSPTHHLIPLGACWNWALRGTLCSFLMFVVRLPRLVSFAPIWWSKLGLWFLRYLGVYTLCQMHQSGFHSFHGGSDRIYILFDMCQLMYLHLFLNGSELVVLRQPLSWFVDWSRSSRHLLTRPYHLLHKCNLDLAGVRGITQLCPSSSAKLLSRGATMKLKNAFVVISLGRLYEIEFVRDHK